jgi:hypothetical protein
VNTPVHRNIGKSAHKVVIKSVQSKWKIMWVKSFFYKTLQFYISWSAIQQLLSFYTITEIDFNRHFTDMQVYQKNMQRPKI